MHFTGLFLLLSFSVDFQALARGRKKRTAAGCFFEVLQLKTWNYIDVSQDTPYEDIRVTKTKRFDEHLSKMAQWNDAHTLEAVIPREREMEMERSYGAISRRPKG